MYERLARPLLFRRGGGDPEAAHEWTLRRLAAAARGGVGRAALAVAGRRYRVTAPRTVFGVRFPNPVGLAAGLDKDGRALPAWPALGFGFVEVGTVTWHPQPGNPRPRLVRLPASTALINRMGFNNAGARALADRLAALGPLPVPLGISLGKSKVTPVGEAVGDYLASLRVLRRYASYVAVNVSSPNTPGLRSLQDRGQLAELVAALVAEADGTPVLVKIAPDLTDHAVADVIEVCEERGVAGLIATNTTLARDGVASTDAGRAAQPGGLSGAPLRERALQVVGFVTRRSRLPVIGVGGITAPRHATALFAAGASLVQLYTGFVYRGPALVRATARAAAGRSTPDPRGIVPGEAGGTPGAAGDGPAAGRFGSDRR